MTESIENITRDQWLSELKPYQAASISSLLIEYGEEEAIKRWLSANGSAENIPFGGENSNDGNLFMVKFKLEFKKLICGHYDYKYVHKNLNSQATIVKAYWIATISTELSSTLGFAATLLFPVVAIMLSTVGKIGLRAYCSSQFS